MNRTSPPAWRPANGADLDAIDSIAATIHPELPERPAVFAEKLRLFPQGCLALVQNGVVVGYGFAHPWKLDTIPPLDTFLRALPEQADCMFIHDVAVLPAARGHDAAGAFIDRIVAVARQNGIPTLALVSVYDTGTLWARYGFQVRSDASLEEKLRSYGATARSMMCSLDTPG